MILNTNTTLYYIFPALGEQSGFVGESPPGIARRIKERHWGGNLDPARFTTKIRTVFMYSLPKHMVKIGIELPISWIQSFLCSVQ